MIFHAILLLYQSQCQLSNNKFELYFDLASIIHYSLFYPCVIDPQVSPNCFTLKFKIFIRRPMYLNYISTYMDAYYKAYLTPCWQKLSWSSLIRKKAKRFYEKHFMYFSFTYSPYIQISVIDGQPSMTKKDCKKQNTTFPTKTIFLIQF